MPGKQSSRPFGTVNIDEMEVRELVKKLRAMPERLDKAMRKEFRELAREVQDDTRPALEREHPRIFLRNGRAPSATAPGGRKRAGEYRWKQYVNSAKAGADADTPFIRFGDDRIPGWAGWQFGGRRYPQFGPRTPRLGKGNKGHTFFPLVIEKAKTMDPRARAIVDKYSKLVT